MSVLAPMTEAQPVLYEAGDRIARITLNRPERGNGIVPALLRGLVKESNGRISTHRCT